MGAFFGISGVVAIVFAAGLCFSRHMLDVTIRLLVAHRAGLKAYHEERRRVLEFERLNNRVMG